MAVESPLIALVMAFSRSWFGAELNVSGMVTVGPSGTATRTYMLPSVADPLAGAPPVPIDAVAVMADVSRVTSAIGLRRLPTPGIVDRSSLTPVGPGLPDGVQDGSTDPAGTVPGDATRPAHATEEPEESASAYWPSAPSVSHDSPVNGAMDGWFEESTFASGGPDPLYDAVDAVKVRGLKSIACADADEVYVEVDVVKYPTSSIRPGDGPPG